VKDRKKVRKNEIAWGIKQTRKRKRERRDRLRKRDSVWKREWERKWNVRKGDIKLRREGTRGEGDAARRKQRDR